MKQEDKQLLLKNLCARLPYGVKIICYSWDSDRGCEFSTVETLIGIDDRFIYTLWRGEKDEHSIMDPLSIVDYKPYLRPMSSMTEEEKKYVKNRWCYEDWYGIHDFLNHYQIDASDVFDFVDWLNENMFDYRGLIEKGLAIAVTDENNPYKE